MSLIAWRKLQAGFSGKGTQKDLLGAVQHIQNNTTVGITLDFDNLIVNNLTVRSSLKIPTGTDKYRDI
ncbi:hypothetical protein LCGC14_0349650 [marine sediment metagenome]|uniref:Uncharacterized protein n=1 Tax=marine sediment metagenome TaxID=412755 RepID=A0A0F9WJ24_9ZZZZ